MRKIVIRIDDITEDMNWEKFYKFVSILDRYEIRPLIGVIPGNQDESLKVGMKMDGYEEWLKDCQKNGWVIAMHGHDHIYSSKKGGLFPLNHFSEFAGVPYETQLEKIKSGCAGMKELGVETDIFMAPAHSFDRNTVKALKECGFRYITDGFGEEPFSRDGMIYLPISFRKSQEFKKKQGITTFVVHTATMKEEDFSYYDKLFAEHRDHFVNYGEMLQREVHPQTPWQRMKEYWLAVLKERICRS